MPMKQARNLDRDSDKYSGRFMLASVFRKGMREVDVGDSDKACLPLSQVMQAANYKRRGRHKVSWNKATIYSGSHPTVPITLEAAVA